MSKKIKLNLDKLNVKSFETSSLSKGGQIHTYNCNTVEKACYDLSLVNCITDECQ